MGEDVILEEFCDVCPHYQRSVSDEHSIVVKCSHWVRYDACKSVFSCHTSITGKELAEKSYGFCSSLSILKSLTVIVVNTLHSISYYMVKYI